MESMLDFSSLDSGTQFKIFDRAMVQINHLSKEQLEKKVMESVALIIHEETITALAENSGSCEECGLEDEAMEWQEFDKTFICPDCGHVQ